MTFCYLSQATPSDLPSISLARQSWEDEDLSSVDVLVREAYRSLAAQPSEVPSRRQSSVSPAADLTAFRGGTDSGDARRQQSRRPHCPSLPQRSQPSAADLTALVDDCLHGLSEDIVQCLFELDKAVEEAKDKIKSRLGDLISGLCAEKDDVAATAAPHDGLSDTSGDEGAPTGPEGTATTGKAPGIEGAEQGTAASAVEEDLRAGDGEPVASKDVAAAAGVPVDASERDAATITAAPASGLVAEDGGEGNGGGGGGGGGGPPDTGGGGDGSGGGGGGGSGGEPKSFKKQWKKQGKHENIVFPSI